MNRIIGSGLIGKSMVNLKTDAGCLIIGAGVSNSGETRASEFLREKELVESLLYKYRALRVVYFSTCSVNQSIKTPYVNHKIAMESMISSLAEEWCIYRLPQVVGLVNNTTLISYLVRAILDKSVLTLHVKARRRLIDIDDVVRVCELLLNSDKGINTVQNIAPSYSVSVVEIVEHIALILSTRPRYELLDSGESYDIDLQDIMGFIGREDTIFARSYWSEVLDKYVAQMRNNILKGFYEY